MTLTRVAETNSYGLYQSCQRLSRTASMITLTASAVYKKLVLQNCQNNLTKWFVLCQRWNRVRVSAHSVGAYTATLYVMVNVVKGGLACTPFPHPHQPGLIFLSWWNIRQKAAVATLYVLWGPYLKSRLFCHYFWNFLLPRFVVNLWNTLLPGGLFLAGITKKVAH